MSQVAAILDAAALSPDGRGSMDLYLNVRNDRVLRLLKAFITVDEFKPIVLVVRRDGYYRRDRPTRGSLEVCRTHWRYAAKENRTA